MTAGEILEKIAPEEYNKLDIKTKEFISKKRDLKTISKHAISKSSIYGSEVSLSGNGIKHKSWNDKPTIKSYVESWLVSDGEDEVSCEINIEYGSDDDLVEYISASNLATPVSGRYKTHGRHCWMVKSGGKWIMEQYFVSNSVYINYINPYE